MTPGEFASFFSRVQFSSGCWEWQGAKYPAGYGKWRDRYCHRIAYEHLVGVIPDRHHLHHVCENKGCCNPAHLTPVTAATHPGIGSDINRRKTHCKHGHEFTPENTDVKANGHRDCRACKYEALRRFRARQKEAA